MKDNKSWLAVRPEIIRDACHSRLRFATGAAILVLLFVVSSLYGDTHYVSLTTKNPKPPFTTWTTAATTIQQAVDAATAGDEVVVTNGVYATGEREVAPINWLVRVHIPKAITLRSVNGPLATVIDGGRQVGCIAAAEGVDLTGFTVRNGVAFGADGGGIYCVSTNVLVGDCVITGNRGGVFGGTLYNCTLVSNAVYILIRGTIPEGGYGGGAQGSMLYNCTLTGNSARTGGGAAYCTLYNCVLTGNTAKWTNVRRPSGPTIYFPGVGGGASLSSLYNCTLTGNSSTDVGGGASSSSLYNCTLTGNSSTGICGGVHDSELYNCILYFNTVPKQKGGANYDSSSILSYCCTAPLPGTGSGNFSLSKNAINTLFVDYAGGNLRLQANSPCVNAGNNACVATPTDLDGNPRIVGGIVDMGAYEFQGSPQ